MNTQKRQNLGLLRVSPELSSRRLLWLSLITIGMQLAFALATVFYDSQAHWFPTLANYLATAVLIFSCSVLIKRQHNRIASLVFGSSLLFLVLINTIKLLLLIFSGKGFTSEVFYHLEPTSFAVGWAEFGQSLLLFGLPLIFILQFMLRQFHQPHINPPVQWPYFSTVILA